MRLLASLFVLFFAISAGAAERRTTLDEAAQHYVHLVLEIGAHEKDFVDAYFGPPEWRIEAEAHPRNISELKAEADRIQSTLGAMDTSAQQPMEHRRNAWLKANVASARSRLDMIEGARFRFRDEAMRLFALTPELRPLESYDPVLERIEALLPGSGSLAERVETFRNRYVIPSNRLDAVMGVAIAECRRRTLAHIRLPANEHFKMEFVTRHSWGAYNWYQGGNQSLIQVNTDLPVFIDRAVQLGCHEGYPGHHVQGIYNERQYRERGLIEFSVAPLYGPTSALNEGGRRLWRRSGVSPRGAHSLRSDSAVSFGRSRSLDGAGLRRFARSAPRSFRRKPNDCGDVSRRRNRPGPRTRTDAALSTHLTGTRRTQSRVHRAISLLRNQLFGRQGID